MLERRRLMIVAASLFCLSSCASADAALDRLDAQVESRSTCHTSTGEWIGGPSCTISHSVSRTTSTTTTTVVTTPAAAPPKAD